MRIVDRTAFLALPAGTIFMKFPAQPEDGSFLDLSPTGEVAIKGETCGNDFVVQTLFPNFEGDDSWETNTANMEKMLAGEDSPPLDYDYAGRDGLFDPKQLFAVWNRDDAERLIGRLQQALADGY